MVGSPLELSERDNIRQPPPRKVRENDGRPPKHSTNDLTCNEADVDELLSAGELT